LRRMLGRRSPQPTLLGETRFTGHDQRLPPALQPLTIDLLMNTSSQRGLVLPRRTRNDRAQCSFMHDDQVMVIQPAPRKHQEPLSITRTGQLPPQGAYQRTTLWFAQPAKAKRFTGQLLMLNQGWCTPIQCA